MRYPEHLLTDDEEVVRAFRPHWRLLFIPALWTLLGIAIVVATWMFWPEVPVVDWIVTGVVVVAVLRLAVYPFVSWFFTEYILTNERLVLRKGILARRGIEIPLENINDVQFSQNIIERMLHSGDLLIESAGERGQSRFGDIPEPEEFQSLIYRVREERSMQLSGGGRAVEPDGTEKLERLAKLLKDGMISQEEYDRAKARLLDEL
ncbi:MAG: PH domain-containing protein [Acidimicrobiia bacterium]|nr:PH domain-containing protein [Acidimicrobiia bacterium]